jgi:hypothetical protein
MLRSERGSLGAPRTMDAKGCRMSRGSRVCVAHRRAAFLRIVR